LELQVRPARPPPDGNMAATAPTESYGASDTAASAGAAAAAVPFFAIPAADWRALVPLLEQYKDFVCQDPERAAHLIAGLAETLTGADGAPAPSDAVAVAATAALARAANTCYACADVVHGAAAAVLSPGSAAAVRFAKATERRVAAALADAFREHEAAIAAKAAATAGESALQPMRLYPVVVEVLKYPEVLNAADVLQGLSRLLEEQRKHGTFAAGELVSAVRTAPLPGAYLLLLCPDPCVARLGHKLFMEVLAREHRSHRDNWALASVPAAARATIAAAAAAALHTGPPAPEALGPYRSYVERCLAAPLRSAQAWWAAAHALASLDAAEVQAWPDRDVVEALATRSIACWPIRPPNVGLAAAADIPHGLAFFVELVGSTYSDPSGIFAAMLPASLRQLLECDYYVRQIKNQKTYQQWPPREASDTTTTPAGDPPPGVMLAPTNGRRWAAAVLSLVWARCVAPHAVDATTATTTMITDAVRLGLEIIMLVFSNLRERPSSNIGVNWNRYVEALVLAAIRGAAARAKTLFVPPLWGRELHCRLARCAAAPPPICIRKAPSHMPRPPFCDRVWRWAPVTGITSRPTTIRATWPWQC